MSRSAIQTCAPMALAAALAATLSACGSSDTPSAAGSGTSVTTSATPAATTGTTTPAEESTTTGSTPPADASGPTGTAKGGVCTWLTPEQIGRLQPTLTKARFGVLTDEPMQDDMAGGTRRSCVWTDGAARVRVGIYTLPTKAKADAFMSDASTVHKKVEGLGMAAAYDAEPTPVGWNQYLTIRHSATVVHGIVLFTSRPQGMKVTDPKGRPDSSAAMVDVARQLGL